MHQHATKIGTFALVIWSFGPLFNNLVSAVPIFEILSFSFGIGFICGCVYLTVTKNWHKLTQPLVYGVMGFAGIFGNELLFVSAFKFAPAAHITLINYLWPILVLTLTGLIRQDRLSLRYMIAAILGFLSVAFYIVNQIETVISGKYWIGYALVLLGTCCWSMYILANRKQEHMPSEMITIYCGLGFIISLTVHCQTETFYLPTLNEAFALCWLGFMGLGLAFNFWDFGIKWGNPRLLSILSYNTVLLSTLILIGFNQTQFDMSLVVAAVGVTLASLVSLAEYPSSSTAARLLP